MYVVEERILRTFIPVKTDFRPKNTNTSFSPAKYFEQTETLQCLNVGLHDLQNVNMTLNHAFWPKNIGSAHGKMRGLL